MIGRHSAVALLVVSLVLPGCGGKVAAPTPLEPAPSPTPTWTNLGLTSSYSQAYALLSDGSRLVAGGAIHDALGRARIAVALWDGGAWSAPVSQPRATVEAQASYGGELIAATPTDTGQFIHRFDGQKWSPLGGGMSGPAIALARYGNGLVCGGSFIKAGGTPASFIAYWDGATWKNLGLGVSNPVYALAVYRGDLIAAGRFWSAGGQPAAYIARWDGAAWHPMGAGMDAIVTTLAVHGETLVAGGYFRTAGGVQVNGVALWDGSAWSALGEGVCAKPETRCSRWRAIRATSWPEGPSTGSWRAGGAAAGRSCRGSTAASRP